MVVVVVEDGFVVLSFLQEPIDNKAREINKAYFFISVILLPRKLNNTFHTS